MIVVNLMNKLPILLDIYHSINVDKNEIDKEKTDIQECLYILIEEYIDSNIHLYKKKDFENIVLSNIYEYFTNLYGSNKLNVSIEELLEETLFMYFIINNNPRSYKDTFILDKITSSEIKRRKNILEGHLKKEQPEQRTKEWYEFRHNRLTASDFYKVFDTQASQNNLILKKCAPIDISKYNRVNTDSAFHHGHTYEPLSIMLYEKKYKTNVGEFGCISHDVYDFLGASPDGINVDEKNERYCRLLEVKNPKSRIPDGKPKKEYWVQMQLQMEVWNLDECDFLETVFHFYETEEQFKNDGTFNLSNDCKEKGIIIQFYDGKQPFYEYPPLDLKEDEFNKWYDECLDKHTNLTWIKNIYWKLNTFSCILVTRNKKWFQSKIPEIITFWNLIKKERITGYEHRKPKKREKKTKPENNIVIKINTDLST